MEMFVSVNFAFTQTFLPANISKHAAAKFNGHFLDCFCHNVYFYIIKENLNF